MFMIHICLPYISIVVKMALTSQGFHQPLPRGQPVAVGAGDLRCHASGANRAAPWCPWWGMVGIVAIYGKLICYKDN